MKLVKRNGQYFKEFVESPHHTSDNIGSLQCNDSVATVDMSESMNRVSTQLIAVQRMRFIKVVHKNQGSCRLDIYWIHMACNQRPMKSALVSTEVGDI